MKQGLDPNLEQALTAALKLLRGRDRFEEEILDHLMAIGCEPEVSEEAMEILRQKRVINDKGLAIETAKKLSYTKFWSANRIREELLKRGAREEHVEAALEYLPPDEQVAGRLFPRLKGDYKKRARRLASLGYEPEVIQSYVMQPSDA